MTIIGDTISLTNSVGEKVKELKSGEVHRISINTSPTYLVKNTEIESNRIPKDINKYS
jgi:hypothetical protein